MPEKDAFGYRVISSLYVSLEGQAYRGYGVALRAGPRELTMEDIFTNAEQAECAARLLNRCRVSPVHLRDVLEDLVVD